MKIAILTFQNANNFGAVLQAYALQKYLINNGVNCEFINYNMNASKNIPKKQLKISKLKNKFLFLKNRKAYIRQRKFDKFRKSFLIINPKEIMSEEDLYNTKMDYDTIVVGSDQVWNSKITNNSKAFYLNFTKKPIKISYAASFGRDFLEEVEVEDAKKYLKNFEAISVREQQVVSILKEITNKDIRDVVDPVFLLEKKEWQLVMKKYALPDKYIFVYLMEEVPEINNILNKINRDSKYKIIYIYGKKNGAIINGKRIEDIGPSEFLYIIDNAEYVVTNSFHGVAFSMILEKKFFVIAHSKYNARIDNIMNLVDQKEKIMTNSMDLDKRIIDGSKVKKKIQNKIDESKAFIQFNIINRRSKEWN